MWGASLSGLEVKKPRACILGVAGTELSNWEKGFFREADPYGFILFARNVEDRNQIRALTSALRDTVGNSNIPIFVDQEGGRVMHIGAKYPRLACLGNFLIETLKTRARRPISMHV